MSPRVARNRRLAMGTMWVCVSAMGYSESRDLTILPLLTAFFHPSRMEFGLGFMLDGQDFEKKRMLDGCRAAITAFQGATVSIIVYSLILSLFAATSDNMVKAIESYDEWKSLIDGSDVVVVDYWATWCGPCKVISPVFAKLEEQFSQLKFVKVDVDAQEKIAKEANVKAMPTFVAYKGGEVIDTVVGAVPKKLEDLLQKVSASS
ncbi:thioredoxin [Cryptococcus depauperatus]